MQERQSCRFDNDMLPLAPDIEPVERLYRASRLTGGRTEGREIVQAHKQLGRNLHGPKLRQALGLPVDEAAVKPARKNPKRPAQEAA